MAPQEARARSMERAPGPGTWLPPAPDPRSVEREVRARWQARNVVERSLATASGGPRWTCAGDPPSASGLPGLHHVPDLAVRDLYQRYRTMRGFDVPRTAGWNCHGLDVEVAVERELGLNGRPDIERYGLGRFAARCRESAMRHEQAYSTLIERIGQWVNPTSARRTMDAGYAESVWACVHRLFTTGLLVRDERIAMYCPRCQTNLSDHELARPASSRTITDDAVTVRFPVASPPEGISPWLSGADLLAVTADPWTLVANAAIAVHPHRTYVVARRAGHDDRVVVADVAAGRVLGEDWHVVARVSGADLAGLGYLPPFGTAAGHRVVTAYFVDGDAGTGLAHLAPGFGAAELDACRAHGLAPVTPIGPDGRFDPDLPLVGGTFFKAADPILIEALANRGLLFAAERAERRAPHCWRCGTVLLARILPAWYLRTSAARDQLHAQDRRTTWIPAPIRPGSDGGWLRSDADWAVSRTRYWGTPLPIWECEHAHLTCVPSRARLSELAGRDVSGIDPHRPAIDAVTFACPACGATARRVPEVTDSYFDAGVMPFDMNEHADPAASREGAGSPAGRPHRADLATQTADGGGGWLYALTAAGTLLAGQPAFDTVLCLGAVLDGGGTAMSRDRGNVVDPLPLIDRYGADALRWLCAAASAPSAARRVTDAALDDVVRMVLVPYWDCVAFFVSQADPAAGAAGSWRRGPADAPPPAARPPLDRWLLSEAQSLIADVTAAFDSIRSAAAGRRIAGFIDELSGWYLHLHRRRYGDGQVAAERAATLATLRECLDVLTRLMAPVVPFLTDYAWEMIRPDQAPDSVHLARWPVPVAALVDPQLADQMALARRIAELCRSARAAAGIGAGQPLARALVPARTFAELGGELLPVVASALDVTTIGQLPADGATAPWHAPAGWAIATDAGLAVALDLEITPELHREGLAREVITLVGHARDADGIGPGERIALRWSAADGDLASALTEFGPMISASVMAAEYGPATADQRSASTSIRGAHRSADLGLSFWIRSLPP